jgi:hypothetical protein
LLRAIVPLAAVASAGGDPLAPVDFSREIRPILAEKCFACHGPDEVAREADLRLDSSESAFADRGGYAVVVPGNAEASELWLRVSDEADPMPPRQAGEPLTEAERALFKRWIEEGAPWSEHWAYRPPERRAPPVLEGESWVRDPLDRWVLARLEQEGLAPAAEAEPAALLRRASFVLTGLPPSLDELDRLLADEEPLAYERALERLLASPRYGEHMARFWLDAARYGDTHGFHFDNERSLWRWRDWVIEAFNTNKPFDEFALEQLAGDLLPEPTLEQLIATGFNRCNPTTGEGGLIDAEYLAKYASDRVNTVATVFLGSTLGCAACHDHKYDPFTQREFYGLFAYFHSFAEEANDQNALAPPPAIAAPTRAQAGRLAELDATLADLKQRLFAPLEGLQAQRGYALAPLFALAQSGAALAVEPDGALLVSGDNPERGAPWSDWPALMTEHARVAAERAALVASIPESMITRERTPPRATHVLRRGQYDLPGEEVAPGVPAVLPPLPPNTPANRLGLARWLTDPHHPLTARVTVNRLWQQAFGRGLVDTPEDFGTRGAFPSHPELLDELALDFAEGGFDVKGLLRRLVTSAAFRQSSAVDAETLAHDPENRLLARAPRPRLDGEELRDQALLVAGLLVEEVGGPSVKPYQPGDLWKVVAYPTSNTASFVQDQGTKLYRRSLYTFWKRTAPPPALALFDAPTREFCSVRRARTNTPLQALALLNDVQLVEAARALATRLLLEEHDDRTRLERGFRALTARRPDTAELELLLAVLAEHRAAYAVDPAAARELIAVGDSEPDAALAPEELAAWTLVANLLLNLDEALTRG